MPATAPTPPVVSANGAAPCGSCRQVLNEFGRDTLILIADAHGTILHELTVADLLPDALAPRIAGMIELGLAAIKRTLERGARHDAAGCDTVGNDAAAPRA